MSLGGWCDSVSKLAWDGTFLPGAKVASTWKHEDCKYAIVELGGECFPAILTTDRECIAAICDECKTLFGLSKLGSHTIRKGNSQVTILRVEHDSSKIVWDVPVNKLDKTHPLLSDDQFKRNVDLLLAYKDIMGIISNTPGNIRVRRCVVTGETYAVSYREKTISMLRPLEEETIAPDPITIKSRETVERLLTAGVYRSLLGVRDGMSETDVFSKVTLKGYEIGKILGGFGDKFSGLSELIVHRMHLRLRQTSASIGKE